MDFDKQYKHPKWQMKRLSKLDEVAKDSDDNSPYCQWCGENDDQLHVHHIRYIKDRKIWEYNNEELLVLCGKCHRDAHALQDEIKDLMSQFQTWDCSLICVRNVLLLMLELGFPSMDYVAELLIQVLYMRGDYESVKRYKKRLENG